MFRSDLPPSTEILRDQPSFKVKLEDKGSNQVHGIEFDASYALTSAFENIMFILAIDAAMNMALKLYDVSNVFQ
eukprot:8420839-Ditylum_brightwellii.AAC.1